MSKAYHGVEGDFMKNSIPEVLGVIPARYSSTRFPGKPLHKILGKSLIQWVWEAAVKAEILSDLVVATDDERIVSEVESFGGCVQMTRNDHLSGTDRLAEISANTQHEIILNIQGDEPLIDPGLINKTARLLIARPELSCTTAVTHFSDIRELENPDCVKVVQNSKSEALYFSRSLIPFARDGGIQLADYLKHIGIYVYRREFLSSFSSLKSRLEELEKLEQLRILENGFRIGIVRTDYQALGVDKPEDLELVEKLLSARLQ
jgi:3-deoxy-manno-octulosonate cytidylyltransferase (CMP-KDO synthetase)